MLRIGITGGIGSGKTTAAAIFELLGIPVYHADIAARRLMQEDPSLRKSIMEAYGEESYAEGTLNRKYLASIVFHSAEATRKLNELVHPYTLNDSARWMRLQATHHIPYCLKEAALIFESGAEKDLDYVIGVEAPLSIRIARVLKRDHISEEEIKSRISRQMEESDKMKRCDFRLINDEKNLLIPQVIELHEKLLSLAAGSSQES